MTSTLLNVLLIVAIISSSLVCGLFLIFSDFLMRSFALARPSAGIQVMQVLNREIWRSVTMILLWGMLVVSAVLAGYSFLYLEGILAGLIVTGAALYLFGALVVSFRFNIPLNDALDKLDYTSDAAASYWLETYVPRWVRWNYLRALTTGSAALCYLLAALHL